MVELAAPLLRRLYADWLAWRGERELPARRDFDPLGIRYIIGKLSLIDVLGEPLRFRYRVHGTENAERLGFDLTGKPLEAWPDPEHRSMVETCFATVVKSRSPLARLREQVFGDGRLWRYEILVLPLSGDGTQVDMLMVAAEFK